MEHHHRIGVHVICRNCGKKHIPEIFATNSLCEECKKLHHHYPKI